MGLAVAGASALGQRTWPLGLFVHFWLQLAICLVLTSIASLLARRPASAAVQALGALVLAAFVTAQAGAASGAAATDSAHPPALRALFANVGRWNERHQYLIERVRDEQPDVVGLAEIDERWLASLDALTDDYPHRVVAARDDNFGIGLLSRFPLSAQSLEPIGPLGLPSITATVETDDGPWRIVVTHPVPPAHAAASDARNRHILSIPHRLGGPDQPTVVLADLNATIWSPIMRDLRRQSGLRSAARGLRARYTWPVSILPLAVEIDYCLYDAPALSVAFRVLESIRSDHYPILCEFVRAE